MDFRVFGPFQIARRRGSVSRDAVDKSEFWDGVEEGAEGLPNACGCYVYVLRNRAWYVGLAERQDFKHECFSIHKLMLYNEALRDKAGKPSLILIAKLTNKGRFAKPSSRGHADIRLLESLLIGSALSRNGNLKNIRGTKLLREMHVPGVLNGKPGEGKASSVQAFKLAIGA